MPLTAMQVKRAKSKDRIYKLFDNEGLFLVVNTSGSKIFKYSFRINNKASTYSIGKYPEVSLKEARELHREAHKLVSEGVNPTRAKQQKKSQEIRFSEYFSEWLAKQNLAESTYKDLVQRVEKNLIPYLDKRPVSDWDTKALYDVLEIMSKRGAKESAIRLAGTLRKVYNELFHLGLVSSNPAIGLAELLPKPDRKQKGNFGHMIEPDEVRGLLNAIHKPIGSRLDIATLQALKLMPLVYLRPKNIRFMKWEYIDFDNKLIHIPAEEMKTNKPLDVPLAYQAIDILEVMKPLTGNGEYVFVSSQSKNGQPISECTTTSAIRKLINPSTGEPYGTGVMTSHGFRHMASTMLNEQGFHPDVIELQLAHSSGDKIRATYNKAQLMSKRTEMMQSWADYLDSLMAGNTNVIPIRKEA